MVAGFPVACCAVGGRALEDPISMTRSAAHSPVRAGEREGRQVMVQRRSLPAISGVALCAVLAKLPAVYIVRLMTGHAVLRCAAVLA